MKPVKGKGNTGREKILVTVQLQGDKETIAQGDGVEIRRRIERSSAEVAADSNVVTYVEELGNSTLRIGDFDSGILAGDRVYKVTDRALREEALAADEKKLPVRMRFCGYIEQKPTLELALKKSEARAEAADGEIINVVGDFAVEKALKKALTEEKIKEQLKKLGDTGFCADAKDICIEIDPDIMIPVSVINQMRRQAAEALSGKLRGAITRKRCTLTEDEIRRVVSAEQLGSEDEVNRVEGMAAVDDQPYILNVSKGELDDYIEGNFASIVDKYRDTGVLIGNLGWIKQFTDAGVQVYGDYGLNAYNGQSIKAYEELCVKMLHTSYERCRDGRTSDKRFKGKIPLMITEHPFDTDYLIDRKGVKHEIIKYGDKNIVL